MSLTDDQIVAKNFKKYHEAILPYLNGSAHSGFTPIGTVISVMGTTAPLNYLACDGTVYNIADYTELAAYFNQQFGSSNFFGGNGTTTFAVPDLRGEFLRGTGTNSHANQGSGANVGVHQDSTNINDTWLDTTGDKLWLQNDGNDGWLVTNGDSQIQSTQQNSIELTNKTTTGSNTGTLTIRPTNTSVLYCIASKNIFMDAGSNYSTEEQVVGTWIDGRPIYQKTISGKTASSAGWNTIGTLDSTAIPVNFSSFVLKSSHNEYYSLCGNQAYGFLLKVTEQHNVVIHASENDFLNCDVIVTLQYTKTS